MYLENVNIENYGGIEKVNYKMPFNEETGKPKPLVIIGKNGSGKTLFISNIVHALIEMKRQVFTNIPETDETKFYRLGSKSYIKNGKNYSYLNYKFSNDISLTDLSLYNYEQFKNNEYNSEEFKGINIENSELKKDGFFQKVDLNNHESEIFAKEIFLYLPVDRYYSPSWLNSSNPKLKVNSIYNKRYVGINSDNIIKNNLLEGIESWMLDVIIDKLLYEEKRGIINQDGKEKEISIYVGKNNNIQTAINKILTVILKNSVKDCISARIGVSSKENRKISILITDIKGKEREYVPMFSNLSSGEIMIFCMFLSILKEIDRITNAQQENIFNTKGIVIIDEIDAHLHLDFCRLILPEIIQMFPQMQFIITSHSPFFLLGMKERFNDNCEFINMPNGTINNLENFDEIKKMYELVEPNYQATLEEMKKYKLQIENGIKPIIVTEGKTDWKHMKNALIELKKRNKYKDLDISFLKYEDNMGDTKLEELLKNMSQFPNNRKIIGIFDNDEKIGIKYDKDSFTNFGNNVYAWTIPNPRNLTYGISIEFLYEDSDIKLLSKDGKRLYLSSEFKQKNLQLKENSLITTRQRNFVETYYKEGKVKIIEGEEVYDENEKAISLSKNEFANNILNKIEPFDKVKTDNFEKLFARIELVLNDNMKK